MLGGAAYSRPGGLLLKAATYEKARQAAPGFDVYAGTGLAGLDHKKGEQPKNPDSAFIGFCRRKAQPKRSDGDEITYIDIKTEKNINAKAQMQL